MNYEKELNYLLERQKEYLEGKPTISDQEYDKRYKEFVEEIKQLKSEEFNKYIQKIEGFFRTNFKGLEVTHTGMDDAFNQEEIAKFYKELDSEKVFATYKYDGTTAILYYENGILVKAETAGRSGKPVNIFNTLIASGLEHLTRIQHEGSFVIKGEIVMEHEECSRLGYRSARSAAAGVIQAIKNPNMEAELKFKPFMIIQKGLKTREAVFKLINSIPELDGIKYFEIKSLNDILELYNTKHALPYPIDGLVISRDMILNSSDNFAAKFTEEVFRVRLFEIEHQIGRTGQITPVAIHDPFIGNDGSENTNASLHNYVLWKPLARGDILSIIKSGAVIPKIISVEKTTLEDELNPPETCPSCGGPVEQYKSTHYCKNAWNYKFCKEAFARKIEYFCKTLQISGVGENYAFDLAGIAQVNRDIFIARLFVMLQEYGLTDKEKNWAKIYKSFKDIKGKVTLAQVIASMSIKNVGLKTIELILEKVPDFLETYIYYVDDYGVIDFSDLTEIDGIGESIAQSLQEFFVISKNKEELKYMIHVLEPTTVKIEKVENSPIEGFSVVQTGNYIENGEPFTREQFKHLLLSYGASLKSSVSGKTNLLVVGEGAGKAKIRAAKEKGVKIVDNEQFRKLIGRENGGN